MKTIFKILAGVVITPILLLVSLLVYMSITHEIEIYSYQIDEDRELVIYGVLDDGPGPFGEVALILAGEQIDRDGVSFGLVERNDLKDEIKIVKHTKEELLFTYTDTFSVYTFRVDLVQNTVGKVSAERIEKDYANKSLDTTRAKRPSCGGSKDISHPTLSRRFSSPRVSA